MYSYLTKVHTGLRDVIKEGHDYSVWKHIIFIRNKETGKSEIYINGERIELDNYISS